MNIDEPATASTDFLRRSLRWLAIVCLVFAVTSLATDVAIISVQGWPYFPRFYGSRVGRRLEVALGFGSLAAMISLLAGAYGLLRWRRWSRIMLLSAAAGLLLFSFASRIVWLSYFLDQLNASRATTRTYNPPPPWYYVSTTMTQWIAYSILPIIVIWTMVQREVVGLWARRGAGGFEVLPAVKVAQERTP